MLEWAPINIATVNFFLLIITSHYLLRYEYGTYASNYYIIIDMLDDASILLLNAM